MFTSIQSLTYLIDKNINYVNEAIENKSNFDSITFNNYIDKMHNTLNNQVSILKNESSNKKLINKYSQKVNDLFIQSI